MKTTKRLIVDTNMNTTTTEEESVLEVATTPVLNKNKANANENVLIKDFAFINKNTGSIRIRGMSLSKVDMLRLLDNAKLIREVIAKDNLERSMKLLGVSSKKDLKKLISSL